MNILQRLLVKISPASPEEEEEKTREYEGRARRRLLKVRGEFDAEVEVPDADDLGRWFGFDAGSEAGSEEDGGDAR